MTRLSFNCPDHIEYPPRNWRVFDFTLYGKISPETWAYAREIIPTNSNWQPPGWETFVL